MARWVVVAFFGLIIVLARLLPGPAEKVVFMDVGQGDAILLQDGTAQVLIDGGPGMTVLRRLGEEMPWFDRTIEVVVLTHPQQDHLEGLLHVLERYEVGMVLLPYAPAESQMQEVWLQKIIEAGIPYRYAWAGQKLTVGNMKIEVLGPLDSPAGAAATRGDLNNASVVMRVDFHDMSFLLTGDAEKRVENLMVQSSGDQLDVDVLKVGHHGSNSSTHEALLAATTPSAAVISVGADNRFGHPREEVLERLGDLPLWRTDEDGTITWQYFKDQWLVR